MKRIRDFKSPTDPAKADELRRQLVQFEQNVSDMGAQLEQAKMARLNVKVRISNAEGLTVAPGQSIGIIAAVTRVQLEAPTAADEGKFLAICKGPGAPSNTTVYAPARTLINGAATYVITANGLLQLFYCDGVDYWTTQ
jgi:hypothetical protein